MIHKRLAFLRKNAKVVIPILIVIIFFFSFINQNQDQNQEQNYEGLSNMNSIEELKKDSNLTSVNNNYSPYFSLIHDFKKSNEQFV
jgi:Na+/H+ antiporter NhaC